MRAFVSSLFLLFAGCSVADPDSSTALLIEKAEQRGFKSQLIKGPLWIPAWTRLGSPGAPIRVYIEGDGHAWHSRTLPAQDPTPANPVALRLALADSLPNIVYLGRPCQYAARQDPACKPFFWTQGRFNPMVIDSFQTALDRLASENSIEAVGYSGGGAVALLLAARQPERYRSITTVAGILDHRAWTHFHQDDPLTSSLNPVDFAMQLKSVPQRHLTGTKDSVVPADIVQSYARKISRGSCLEIIPTDATHQEGWLLQWDKLVNTALHCRTSQ